MSARTSFWAVHRVLARHDLDPGSFARPMRLDRESALDDALQMPGAKERSISILAMAGSWACSARSPVATASAKRRTRGRSWRRDTMNGQKLVRADSFERHRYVGAGLVEIIATAARGRGYLRRDVARRLVASAPISTIALDQRLTTGRSVAPSRTRSPQRGQRSTKLVVGTEAARVPSDAHALISCNKPFTCPLLSISHRSGMSGTVAVRPVKARTPANRTLAV